MISIQFYYRNHILLERNTFWEQNKIVQTHQLYYTAMVNIGSTQQFQNWYL